MPELFFIEHNGTTHRIQSESGVSLLQAAISNLVPGMLGDCGGCCSCATCHCYIDNTWSAVIPLPSQDEAMLIDGALHVTAESRLACQITVSDDMNGIVIRLPESQM